MPTGFPEDVDRSYLESTVRPSMIDIGRAAGYYEGDGSCANNGGGMSIQIRSVDPWPLHWMRDRFGGSIRELKPESHALTEKPVFGWWLAGPRARGFAFTVYSLVSPRRREQLRIALT